MEPFKVHKGIGVPLRRSNVDTDQIIPAVYLKRVTRTGFEDGLFAAWRSDPGFHFEHHPLRPGKCVGRGTGFRYGIVARACGLGIDGLRLPGGDLFPLRRHLPGQRR